MTKKYVYPLMVVLLFTIVGYSRSEQLKNTDSFFSQNESGNFVLYVSNQSYALTPVDITIHIDGKTAISEMFEVENQHNWIKYIFKLEPGKHNLFAVSNKGVAEKMIELQIEEEKKYWANLNYWYYPKQDGEKLFTFNIYDKPIRFQ